MFTVSNYDYECTKKCRLLEHGNSITSAITKRSINDEYLAAYIAKICKNFADILDDKGRSALHMAASTGRYAVAEWLINYGANLTLKDRENSHTPIHRACYYGFVNLAVLFQKYGASIDIPDEDFVNPLQLCCDIKVQQGSRLIGNELMVWGRNRNYNLGIGNVQGKESPDYLDFFRKNKITIRKMSISMYHSIFLTYSDELYTAGHGRGGRLGTGNENTLVSPTKITIPKKQADEVVVDVGAGKYHTLVLTSLNIIYSCGESKYSQLGIKPPPEKQLTFREISGLQVMADKNMKRVIAKDYHSIAIGESTIYVWGTNGGQFGMKKEINPVILPNELPLNAEIKASKIKLVESSNAAIVCYTESKFLYIFSNFKLKSYKNPLMETFECISVTGGEFSSKNDEIARQNKPLRILAFTIAKNIYIWYEDIQMFVRCIFAQSRNLEIEKIMWCKDHALVLLLGNLYEGKITDKFNSQVISSTSEYKDTYVKKEICATSKTKIELKRVKNVNNAVNFVCDDEGENFGVLVENCRRYFNVPELIEENYDFGKLLLEADEMDGIHDIIFHVDHQAFPAHKFIIYCRSKHLKKVVENSNNKHIHLTYVGLTARVFEIALRYIYTNAMICKKDIVQLLKDDRLPNDAENTTKMVNALRKILKYLDLGELAESMKILSDDELITRFPILERRRFPELQDVTLKLANQQEILAHKCVLVARLEYFNMMFNQSWSETKVVNLKTIPFEYMDVIVDFLYSNNIEKVKQQKYSESYLYNMITICDQFFVEELKNVFELMIGDKINLKNVAENLEFAFQYNCEILKELCMQFTSVNLAKILEMRSLEMIKPSILDQISKYYRKFYNLNDYRTITPCANAADDEEIVGFVSDFSVDLAYKKDDGHRQKTPKSKTTKSSKIEIEKRNYEKIAMDSIRNLSIEENGKQSSEKKLTRDDSFGEVMEKEIKSWHKVTEKKEINDKKKIVLAGIKLNEVLKNEGKKVDKFTSLKAVLEKEPSPVNETTFQSSPKMFEDETIHRPMTFSLGDITPKMKLSQRQRKRLSSDNIQPKEVILPESPVQITPMEPSNPWKIVNNPIHSEPIQIQSPKSAQKDKNRLNGSFESKSPIQNLYLSMPSTSKASKNKDFNKILEDEKKQKQYYDKIKSKSLILTQIEEKAIEELRDFYNVDNVFDENITVDRFKPTIQNMMNFAVWQHQ